MQANMHTAARFYESHRGRVAARLLGQRMTAFWPGMPHGHTLGLGYALPFLPLWDRDDAPCMSARLDTHVTRDAPPWQGRDCITDGRHLPFEDLKFDRILLIHALEVSEDKNALLRQVWKILRDDGRLLLVVPNRAGLWAHTDNSPFGQGTPFSRRQIGRWLADACFRAERYEDALYIPPVGPCPATSPGMVEWTGRNLFPRLGGVCMIEAVKDIYAGVPTRPAVVVPGGLRLGAARVFSRSVTQRRPPTDAQNT
ncbi:bifunctional 2-polyprenyl-6-hydroxyphenol methylase/3-demethylubiquinol 3-O-methyltransferase UbiG [Komagataeibacter sp. FNDCF1]|uniref:class I SAM-dependent methyltransferase n=1 Tax=Komagataeibacter sp. FNDCF1 TaxID=2878681 RepID=UPI001E60B278|nr:methyltransferase domain-containing protein [Komagataeibacter sp. FNDCF1]MCE2564317.1 class I SAM-dependent methyltransferase [Komagataeibacter sp. FNDCF1]